MNEITDVKPEQDISPATPPAAPANPPALQAEARAIAMDSGGAVAPIVPRNLHELALVAGAVIKAGLAPDSYKGRGDDETKSRIMIGIMKGAEVGLPPMAALANIYIVNNRPTIFGDGAIALAQASGRLEWMREDLTGQPNAADWTARCVMKRKGQEALIERTFSWGDAMRAGLTTKGPWKLYPQRMLQMRARAWAIRDGFADCLSGLAIKEEVEDMPAPPHAVDTTILDDEPITIDVKDDAA